MAEVPHRHLGRRGLTGTMIEAGGHFLAEERPEAVLDELRRFPRAR